MICLAHPLLCSLLLVGGGSLGDEDAADQWPQWRGPLATGVAPVADPPVKWGEDLNVRWKIPLPGRGHSTPIVWGERIFVTSAVPFGDELPALPDMSPGAHDNAPITHRLAFVVLAIARSSGEVLWERTLHEELPHERAHVTATFASNSPVTDGAQVFASFGSRGVFALDLAGEVQWAVDLGRMRVKHGHGEGSSPVLHGDTLVINWDHEGPSFLVALDKHTGEERWRVARDEMTSWATPIVVEQGGKPQVVVSGSNRVRGYDLETGKPVWECAGLSNNVVASPVSSQGMLYAGSSYEKKSLLAIRLEGAGGDITETDNVLWRRTRGTPYVPSPLLYGDALYFLSHYQGVMTRVRAVTGENWPGAFRLEGMYDIYASPVGAAGRVYITDRDGLTIVIEHGENPTVLAQNRLDDAFNASAALVGREIFLRGEQFLYCIAEQ